MGIISNFFLASFTLVWLSDAVIAFGLAGPYDLAFRRLEHCPDEGTGEITYTDRMNKLDKYLYAYNGEIVVPYDIDDRVTCQINVFKKMINGDWAPNAYNYECTNLCENMRELMPVDFEMATTYMGLKNECPVPAGTYKAANWTMVLHQAVMEELPYGEYYGEYNVLRDGKIIGCVRIYCDIVERAVDIKRGR